MEVSLDPLLVITHNVVVNPSLDAALLLEGGGQVSGHLYPEYLDCSVREAMVPDELLGGEDGRSAPVRGRAALQLGQRGVDQGRLLDLLQGVLVLKPQTGNILC